MQVVLLPMAKDRNRDRDRDRNRDRDRDRDRELAISISISMFKDIYFKARVTVLKKSVLYIRLLFVYDCTSKR